MFRDNTSTYSKSIDVQGVALEALNMTLNSHKQVKSQYSSLKCENEQLKRAYQELYDKARTLQQNLKNQLGYKSLYEELVEKKQNKISTLNNDMHDVFSHQTRSHNIPQGHEYKNCFPYIKSATVDRKTPERSDVREDSTTDKKTSAKIKYLSKKKDKNYINFKIQKLEKQRQKLEEETDNKQKDPENIYNNQNE